MRSLLPPSVEGARPFDPEDRPRVGEWVRVVPNTLPVAPLAVVAEPAWDRHAKGAKRTGLAVLVACVAAVGLAGEGIRLLLGNKPAATASKPYAEDRVANFEASIDPHSRVRLEPKKAAILIVNMDATPRWSSDPVKSFALANVAVKAESPLKAEHGPAVKRGEGWRIVVTIHVPQGHALKHIALEYEATAETESGRIEKWTGGRIVWDASALPPPPKIDKEVPRAPVERDPEPAPSVRRSPAWHPSPALPRPRTTGTVPSGTSNGGTTSEGGHEATNGGTTGATGATAGKPSAGGKPDSNLIPGDTSDIKAGYGRLKKESTGAAPKQGDAPKKEG